MNHDVRDVPVSPTTSRALAGYETALAQFQSYIGDAVGTLDATLAEAPDFVMGHLFKALALFTASEKQFMPAAEASLVRPPPRGRRAPRKSTRPRR